MSDVCQYCNKFTYYSKQSTLGDYCRKCQAKGINGFSVRSAKKQVNDLYLRRIYTCFLANRYNVPKDIRKYILNEYMPINGITQHPCFSPKDDISQYYTKRERSVADLCMKLVIGISCGISIIYAISTIC